MGEENKIKDDGSLGFLKIPRDESSRYFNCSETTQQKLINTQFWGWAKYSNSNKLLTTILKKEVYEKIKLRHKTPRANAA